MNLFALEGHKVWCSTLVGGDKHDQELAESYLEKYMSYTVERTKVYSFHTDVWLKEFPNVCFNSVFFEDVVEQPMEKTKQHHDFIIYNGTI